MERRLGGALILVENKESVNKLNQILTTHASVIIGRQGIPLMDRGVSIISLVLQGTTDEISALTGPIGKLDGVQVKSLMMKGNPL
jgi:putative iron-only hydrogenase system regulator